MRQLTTALLLILLIPFIVFAGEIYGTIKFLGQPVAGVKVQIETQSAIINKETKKYPRIKYSAKTDKYGSYSITVNELGKWTLTVYKGNNPTFTVTSDNTKARYNFVLERNKNQYKLRRVY